MNARTLLHHATGRLFQQMTGAITLGVLFIAAASIYLTFYGFDSLHQEVTDSLSAGTQEIGQTLDNNLQQVTALIADTEQTTRESLTDYLTSNIKGELATTNTALHDSLMETTEALADMLSAVAPEPILGKNYSTLVNYVKVANRNPKVVYAVFMRTNDTPYTRYVNRNNPLVKDLIEKGEGRTPLDKLLSAAQADPNIVHINRPILFEGKELGSVYLGISVEELNLRVSQMQGRFDKLIDDSEIRVQESLQTVAQTITKSLKENFSLVSETSGESSAEAQRQIESSAGRLIWTQVGTVSVIGVLILLALCSFLLIRIMSPLGRANEIARGIAAGDLNQQVDITGRNEIGQLGESMSVMITNLKQDIEETHRQADEATRIRIALDNVSSSVMMADKQRRIFYMNKAAQHLFKDAASDIQKDLPEFDGDALLGSSIDDFHQNSARQAQLLDSLEKPYTSELKIGGRSLRIIANPVTNDQGERLGTAVEWTDRTAEVAVENEIEHIVKSAHRGDLSQRIELNGKQGFFKMLGTGINALIDQVEHFFNELSEVMASMAQGNLRQPLRGDYQGSFNDLKSNVNDTLENLRATLSQLRESMDEMRTAAHEISSGNNNLSSRTDQQASSLEETASSMEELTGAVRNNSDSAQQANQLAANARSKAKRGGDVVSNAVQAMDAIHSASNKISEIIGVIDEIAFQTNLLALNASVEAARAGEQGRGFAVVATEVRNLAGRSATAAKAIKELIRDSGEKVQMGAELVNQSGETLGEIVEAVQKVGDIIAEIAASSSEQRDGIDQVNQAVVSMDELTQQNAALAEETSAASSSMLEKADKLNELVARFQV